MDRNKLENSILPILNFVGLIGAIITCIAYIALVIILITGFRGDKSPSQTLLFSIVNGVVGFAISQMLKLQGVVFAREIPENKKLLEQYLREPSKTRKLHSLKHFWVTSIIQDIATKAITITASTFAVIYIAIEGTKDPTLIWLALVNLLLFICFGLLALVKAYNNYNGQYMAYIQQELDKTDKGEEKCQ